MSLTTRCQCCKNEIAEWTYYDAGFVVCLRCRDELKRFDNHKQLSIERLEYMSAQLQRQFILNGGRARGMSKPGGLPTQTYWPEFNLSVDL